MRTYILRDPIHSHDTSKTHNFSLEWSKWFPYVKMAFPDIKMSEKDIVVFNLHKGNPYGKFRIPRETKKIFVVHTINATMAKFLEDAHVVIYMNPVQKEIAEKIYGIDIPSLMAPRHPMFEFKTDVNQVNTLFIGGWFFEDRVKGLLERVQKIHNEIPMNYDFTLFPIWGGTNQHKKVVDQFTATLKEHGSEFGSRKVMVNMREMFHDIMVFKTRTCKKALLWDNGPTIEEVSDLVAARDSKVLDYSVGESSMLALFQSSPKDLIVEKKIKYNSYFTKPEKFTYKQFSSLIKEAISLVSK